MSRCQRCGAEGRRWEGARAVCDACPGLLAIPATFWHDHADRFSDDAPEAIGTRGACVLVAADDPRLPGLLADARYYADADSMDECPRNLRVSARRTVDALARIGGDK